MIEKRQKIQDNKRLFASVFTDLSEVFHYISHELLTTKLNASGFDTEPLKFILAYFTNRKKPPQR